MDIISYVKAKKAEEKADAANASLAQKVTQGDSGVITYAMAAQDFREQITGGNTAVVGRDSVLEENIVNGAVSPTKTSFIVKNNNLYNKANDVIGMLPNTTTGELQPNSLFDTSKLIQLEAGKTYTISCEHKFLYLFFWYSNGVYSGSAKVVTVNSGTNYTYTFTADDTYWNKIKIAHHIYSDNIKLEEGSAKTEYVDYGYSMDELIIPSSVNKLNYGIFDQAYIKDRMLVCNYTENNTTTAKYTGVDLGEGVLPVSVKFKVIFSKGEGVCSAMAISNPNGLHKVADITNKSCHFGITRTYAAIEWFTNTVNDNKYKYTFPSELLADGETEYEFGWSVDDTTVTFSMPDGTTQIYTDDQLSTHLGRYITFEHFANGIGSEKRTLPQFTYLEIVDSLGKTHRDNFRRFDGAPYNMPTGLPYTQITN